jgi:hypothetical protein
MGLSNKNEVFVGYNVVNSMNHCCNNHLGVMLHNPKYSYTQKTQSGIQNSIGLLSK